MVATQIPHPLDVDETASAAALQTLHLPLHDEDETASLGVTQIPHLHDVDETASLDATRNPHLHDADETASPVGTQIPHPHDVDEMASLGVTRNPRLRDADETDVPAAIRDPLLCADLRETPSSRLRVALHPCDKDAWPPAGHPLRVVVSASDLHPTDA
jgi:hypothetical protein